MLSGLQAEHVRMLLPYPVMQPNYNYAPPMPSNVQQMPHVVANGSPPPIQTDAMATSPQNQAPQTQNQPNLPPQSQSQTMPVPTQNQPNLPPQGQPPLSAPTPPQGQPPLSVPTSPQNLPPLQAQAQPNVPPQIMPNSNVPLPMPTPIPMPSQGQPPMPIVLNTAQPPIAIVTPIQLNKDDSTEMPTMSLPLVPGLQSTMRLKEEASPDATSSLLSGTTPTAKLS